jgi:hypothetical protein
MIINERFLSYFVPRLPGRSFRQDYSDFHRTSGKSTSWDIARNTNQIVDPTPAGWS